MQMIPVGSRFDLVSDEDYDRLKCFTWHFNSGYVRTQHRDEFLYMHNMVLGFKGVDHVNGQNRKKQLGTSSQYKGVSWDKHRRKWTAHIRVDGRTRCLGGFMNELDAAKAYDAAAQEHFGEFAHVNVP